MAMAVNKKIIQYCDEFGRLVDVVDNGDGTYSHQLLFTNLTGTECLYIPESMIEDMKNGWC